ncbi:MAG: hypothetical protein IJV32_05070 [Bacteroidales bacterium]|nr:hypothetical protein [Bacteroidales bacterium]
MLKTTSLRNYSAPETEVLELVMDTGLCQSNADDVSIPSVFGEDTLIEETFIF